ncbi:MAG: AAA-like domain-containing protein [Cyanobacteria bacterium P01_A01_bin.37]
MTVEDALALVNATFAPEYLNDVQEFIFRQCWLGKTYQEIAAGSGYTHDHVRRVGAQLWQSLSDILGEKATKSNFRAVLQRYQHQHPMASSRPDSSTASDTALFTDIPQSSTIELPTGPVPLGSPFYIERSPIESRCYETILQPGALIRIKAPRQMGKTSLMARVLHHAQTNGYQTVALSLRQASVSLFSNPERFLFWFCATVTYQLGLPNRLADSWDEIFGGNSNSTRYFEKYLLPALNTPLVLAIDDTDAVFQYPELATDFLGLLRAWYEKAKYGVSNSDQWQKLHLIVIHSTEVYIPLPTRQSPFNVGLSIELPELTLEQVIDLACRYSCDWKPGTLDSDRHAWLTMMMNYLGGHPYRLKLAFYYLLQNQLTLETLLTQSPSTLGIYQDILRRQWQQLQHYPSLVEAYRQVVRSPDPVQLAPKLIFELQSLGLVQLAEGGVLPCCQLYRDYFDNRLNVDLPSSTGEDTPDLADIALPIDSQ